MSYFIGRQPILDVNKDTYGYELLFRSGLKNAYDPTVDGDMASMSVINNLMLQSGVSKIAGKHHAFLNFTRKLLLDDYVEVLPKKQVIIEILEDIEPDAEVEAACKKLAGMGYTLALDDYIHHPSYEKLFPYIKIIKVDLWESSMEECQKLADLVLPMGIKLLAERVEKIEEFEQTKAMGFSYFQGYFFSKPVIVHGKEVPESSLTKIQLIHEVAKKNLDLKAIENIIKHDPGLSTKLLRIMNSAVFGLSKQIGSIRQALTLLGDKNVRKWATLLSMANNDDGEKPEELIKQAVKRARVCEVLSGECNLKNNDQDLFVTGLFSLLDTITDMPLDEILNDIPIAEEIVDALLRNKGEYFDLLEAAVSFETYEWGKLSAFIDKYSISEDRLAEIDQEAIEWVEEIVQET